MSDEEQYEKEVKELKVLLDGARKLADRAFQIACTGIGPPKPPKPKRLNLLVKIELAANVLMVSAQKMRELSGP